MPHGVIIILGLAVFNGIFSPYLSLVWVFYPVWYPGFLPVNESGIFFLNSLFTSTLFIMISGLFAALYQQISWHVLKQQPKDSIMYGVWIGGMALMTVPALGVYSKIG